MDWQEAHFCWSDLYFSSIPEVSTCLECSVLNLEKTHKFFITDMEIGTLRDTENSGDYFRPSEWLPSVTEAVRNKRESGEIGNTSIPTEFNPQHP